MARSIDEIDQELRALLAERRGLFAGSGTEPTRENVPADLWESVRSWSEAAPRQLRKSTEPKKIVIVGGSGMMGQFMIGRFEAAGHEAMALGRREWERAREILAGADLVIISVPIDATTAMIEKIAPMLDHSTALSDITSIKKEPLAAMMNAHPGPVMGLHPMFGPGVESYLAQRVVYCPGRGSEHFQWLLDFMAEDGANLVKSTPEEHDHMMTAIQALRHFATFSTGDFLARRGADVARTLEFSSPIYRLELDMICRLFAQDAQLYVDIMLATDERIEAIRAFADNINRLADIVQTRDRDRLIAEFDQTAKSYGTEAERAMKESSFVIRALARHIAQTEGEKENAPP